MTRKEEAFIGGRRPVAEALRAGMVKNLILQQGSKGEIITDLLARAKAKKIPWRWLEPEKFRSLARRVEQHQGVLAALQPYQYASLEQLLAHARQRGEKPFLLLVDHLQDPGNLGSLLRTAEAVGVHGVIIPKRRAVGITPAVYKASSGALAHLQVARATNLVRTVRKLKKENLWVFGSAADGADTIPYYQGDFTVPLVLAIGSEGAGLAPLLRQNCDFLLSLPMRGKIEALNAGVAGALLMYEVLRCRAGWQV